jgi:CubicO group peptidase (beta-lactamase class C family)
VIEGPVAPGFERIKDTFQQNFEKRKELGAALCVYLNGVKIVDCWGGYLDIEKKRPWNQDSRVMVFSITKAMCALSVALWVSRGQISYNTKIADVWPEFRQHGKENITLRQLLEHRAGLFSVKEKITFELLKDKPRLAQVLAAQVPESIGKAPIMRRQ